MRTIATKRKHPKHDWAKYPDPDDSRTGCKVGWYIYRNKSDADACSKAAQHNAVIQASLGYDFGYCCPGSITTLDDGRFEVCIP